MDAILTELAPQLITLAGLILIGLASWSIAILETKVKVEAGKAALDQVNQIITAVVGNLSQTVADELKEAAADGKLTKAEQARLKQKAIEDARNLLSKELTKAAQKAVSNLDTYISKKIEEQVTEYL